MSQKRNNIIYKVATILLTLLMLMSASMYVFTHAEVAEVFTSLGFPTYIIYPLAAAKVLGLVAIWTKKSAVLKEWAYAGFFFNFLLAFAAHYAVNDGEHFGALMALVLLAVSYKFENKG